MSIERLKSMKENFLCAVESQMFNLAEVDAEELGEVVDMIKDLSEAIYYCEVTKAMEESEKNEKNGNGHQQEMMYYAPPIYYEGGPVYYNDGRGQGGRGSGGGRGGQGGRGSGGQDGQGTERSGNTDGRDMSRMYYNGDSSGGSSGGGGRSSGGNSGGSGGGSYGGSGSGGGSQHLEREFPGAFQDEREGRSPRSRRMYMEAKQTHQDKATQMRELERYMQELAQDMTEMIEGSSPEERQYLSKKISALATKLNQTNG